MKKIYRSAIDSQSSFKSVNRFLSDSLVLIKKVRLSISVALLLVAMSISSCNKFLDVVPDNIATIEQAFKLRNEAEKYLFTCYAFLPKHGDGWFNAGMMAGDEMWMAQTDETQWHAAFRIAQGQQNKDVPLFDDWAGFRKGSSTDTRANGLKIFNGIRHCNVFLENIKDPTKVPDITLTERTKWIGEVEFLKAYYHYYMLRMYGPVPILDKSMDVDGPVEAAHVKRMPVDDCVNYISDLLDSAASKLPPGITNENTEMGRITKPIALAIKAKLWLLAASPLFNGNSDYADFKNNDGTALFNPTFDVKKWEKARDAAKDAIEAAEQNGHSLYRYENDPFGLSSHTKTQLNIRNAVTERWSKEHVWAFSNSYFVNEALCMPPMERGSNSTRGQLRGVWAAPIKIAKMFYTSNGVPIEEDETLNFTNYETIRTALPSERFAIEPNYQTARLNFDREPRFYADLGFDGGVWYQKDGNALKNDIDTYYIKAKNGDKAGLGDFLNWNETGYFIKKLVHWESTTAGTSAPVWKTYPWPEIRLADLYLMYAEALNEAEPASALAIEYVDKVRDRAGLKGIVYSWVNFSNNKAKFSSQVGLRAIIRRERLIELAFEGQRFWDLRRWKEASVELNKNITGWNVFGKTTESYYKETVIYNQRFITPRDYFWPIGNFDTRRNPNLVENPGW